MFDQHLPDVLDPRLMMIASQRGLDLLLLGSQCLFTQPEPGRRHRQGQARQPAGCGLGFPVLLSLTDLVPNRFDLGLDGGCFQTQAIELIGIGLSLGFVLCPLQPGIGQFVGFADAGFKTRCLGRQRGRVGLDPLPLLIACRARLQHLFPGDGLMMTHELLQGLFALLDVAAPVRQVLFGGAQSALVLMLLIDQALHLGKLGHQHRLQAVDRPLPLSHLRPCLADALVERCYLLPILGQRPVRIAELSGLIQQGRQPVVQITGLQCPNLLLPLADLLLQAGKFLFAGVPFLPDAGVLTDQGSELLAQRGRWQLSDQCMFFAT